MTKNSYYGSSGVDQYKSFASFVKFIPRYCILFFFLLVKKLNQLSKTKEKINDQINSQMNSTKHVKKS